MRSGLARVGLMAFLVIPCLLLTSPASARTWTDDLNRTWQGEFVRVAGPSAIFLVDGKEYPFPLARLSAADKVAIFKLRQTPPGATVTPAAPDASPVPSSGPVAAPSSGAARSGMFGSVPIELGNTVETDLPLPKEFMAAVNRAYDFKVPSPDHIRASLTVPADFIADKPQKVLVVSVSATGDTLSIADAKHVYAHDALAHGYLVLAADGGYGKAKGEGDSTDYRLLLLRVALAELNARFPQAKKDWTFATAGFSGGCGYAGHQALWLSAQGYHVTGIMMLNCNYPPTQWEHDPVMRGNTSQWHRIPAFFSYGENDDVATPAKVKEAIETTRRGGYQFVRAEPHPGRHEVCHPHIHLALDWFDSLAHPPGH